MKPLDVNPIGIHLKKTKKNFLSSIDLFFASKSSTMPVTVELRTMINGFPTREVIPFSQTNKAAADINTSTDASTATTFTFPSPVYVQDGVEYCFTMPCSTTDCTIYTARMGQKTLDGSRLISKGDLLGFEIAGADKKYVFANAKIINNQVELYSDKIKNPLYARYAWKDKAVPSLFNLEGLPASSFK